MQGQVVKRSGDKTIAVEIVTSRPHSMYGKSLKRTKRYLVHDERNEAEVGQTVTIMQTRPLSARKRWRLVK